MNEKNAKLIKRSYAFKDDASFYYIEILNSFNPELQLKDTESVIKNKPIDLLSELKGFKFVTALALESKKIESKDKTKYDTLHSNSKAEVIINKSDINYVFELIYALVI